MEGGEKTVVLIAFDARAASGVEVGHVPAGVVESIGCSKEGKETVLDGGIREDGEFGRGRVSVVIWSGLFALGKLAADGGVADGDSDGAGEDEASVVNDVGADAGQAAVDYGWVGGFVVSAGRRFNSGVAG